MRIAVVRETRPGEARVALVPEVVGELVDAGHHVLVEPGAGASALVDDAAYAAEGAEVGVPVGADVVLAVGPPPPRLLRPGGAALTLAVPDAPTVAALAETGVTSFALERVPRTSRAQAMDAQTSQALVVGYRGAVVGAELLRRFLPLTMTAAGTVPAARALVLGTGVAGLEAIATLRRLGAHVAAYDVRASAAEEIRSLGAEAVDLGLPPLQGVAGYARELTADRAEQQRRLLAPYVAQADLLLTAASVPGRPAPVLVSRTMVEQMGPGSVVVDLAAEAGGNVEGVVAGEVVRVGHAQVWGGRDVASQLPQQASRFYARNMVALLLHLVAVGALEGEVDDDIAVACCLTRAGRVLGG